ncbi:MAG TPA: superoxide dismutase [Bacteroidales bacterium]|nr:superoxide dismutase [Lentimicrobiaceae bacterium]HOH99694.1 superoxide dismutase [Bacteroidales bacterium]
METLVHALIFLSLPYSHNALEPYIDAQTMEIHHSKHHKAYYDKLMAAVAGTEMEKLTFGDLMANISKYPAAVRNNGGGFYNHNLYWSIMSPNGGGQPGGELGAAITATFGSFEKFKEEFSNAGANRFGSGWAWLVVTADKKLKVCSTANQDNPLMDVSDCKGTPILAMDVWEHAYYLKYQNRRPDYIDAFFKVINWEEVSRLYKEAI